MSVSSLLGRASRLAIVVATAGLGLAACQQQSAAPPAANATAPAPLAAIPLAMTAAPTIAPAPAANALPPARPANVGRLADSRQAYAFADRAAAMNAGFGDAPPDYTFDYGGGERPWVWRADDRSTRIAEPLQGGGDRSYYYEAGAPPRPSRRLQLRLRQRHAGRGLRTERAAPSGRRDRQPR